MPVDHLYVLFGRSVQFFCLFFNQVVFFFFKRWFVSTFYIFWILIPYQLYIICKYFFLFILSFCFVDGFLCCAKGFRFNYVPFIYFALGDGSKTSCDLYQRVLSMFSSRHFMISSLTVGALEFIFIYGIRECSDFIVFHVAVQFSHTTYWRDCLFSI